MEQPNLSFFLQTQSRQRFMVGRKSTLRQCYPETTKKKAGGGGGGGIFVRALVEFSDHLIFCAEKNKLCCTRRNRARKSEKP